MAPTLTEGPLTADDHDILVFCEQHWHVSGSLPSIDRAEELGLERNKYEKALLKKQFQEALAERGIIIRSASQGFKARTLTPEQLAVANALIDLTDTRSQKKKLQDFGISTSRYQAWLKDPIFREYLQDRAESTLDDNAHEVNLALMDSVRSGNIKAIEYYNEITGRFVPMSRRGGANAPAVDSHTLITSIIEIIQQRVKDPEVQGLIAGDLRRLIERNHMATQLTGGSAAGGAPVGASEPVSGALSGSERPVGNPDYNPRPNKPKELGYGRGKNPIEELGL